MIDAGGEADAGGVVRLVLHHQVGREAVQKFVEVVRTFLERKKEGMGGEGMGTTN